MTDLELISEIRRADNPKALELLRKAIAEAEPLPPDALEAWAVYVRDRNPRFALALAAAEKRGRMEGSREMAERLSEENARLRALISKIVEAVDDGFFGFDPYYRDIQKKIMDEARAALAGQQPAQPEGGGQ